MRTRFCTLGRLVALAVCSACTAPPPLPPPAAAAVAPQEPGCEVRLLTTLPLNRVRDFLLVPAVLNGGPVQMLLDTGSEVSAISPGVAQDLRLPQDSANGRVLRGWGGDVRTGSVLADGFALGDLPPRPARFSLAARDLLPGQTPPVAGLLGMDELQGQDLDLDAPSRRGGLYAVRRCPGFQPFPGRGVSVAGTPTGLGFVVAEIDGSAVRALLDTGARNSLMSRRLAQALGVTDEALQADPVVTRIGVSRAQIEVRQHRFGSISLGPATWRDVPVSVASVSLPGVDMLLGADLLLRQRIWLSGARSMLWLR